MNVGGRVVFRKLAQLQRMQSKGGTPTIGEINMAYDEDVKYPPWPFAPKESDSDVGRQFKLKELNKERDRQYKRSFQGRPDYGLFLLVRSGRYTADAWSSLGRYFADLSRQMTTRQPLEIIWGWQAVLAIEMLKQFERCGMSDSERQWVSNHRRQLLSAANTFNLDTDNLPNAERACALTRLLTRTGRCKTRYDLEGNRLTFDEARELAQKVEDDLIVVFGDVGGGQSLDWNAVWEDARPLLPLWGRPLFVALSNALFCTRGTARNALSGSEWNKDVSSLMVTLAKLAVCAWHTAKGIRIQAVRESPNSTRTQMSDAQEMTMLLCAGRAQRDAGEYLTAAVYAHRWMWTVKDEILESARTIGTDLAYFVRQCEFTVDEDRFPWNRDPSPSCSSVAADNTASLGQEAIEDNAPDPSRMRRAWDQKMNPVTMESWAQVLKHFPERSDDSRYNPLGQLVYRVHKDRDPSLCNNTVLLRSALRLCLYYMLIDDAAKLLQDYPLDAPLSWEELDLFVRRVEDAQRVMPFGIDMYTHQEWQTVIRDRLARLTDDERQRMSAEDWLRLHEVLLGRCVSVIRSARFARAFAHKFYGLLEDDKDQIREMYRLGSIVGRSRLESVSIETLGKCAPFVGGSGLGQPAFISLLELRPQEWSLLAAGGKCVPYRSAIKPKGDVRRDIETIQGTRCLWEGIPWDDGVWILGMEVVEAVTKLNPNCEWLILTVEPSLATLPWQHLLCDCAKEFGGNVKPFVVSIVPSLDWAVAAYKERRRHTQGVEVLLSDEASLVEPYLSAADGAVLASDPLIETRRQIDADNETLGQRFGSAVIAYGHGRWGSLDELLPPDRKAISEKAILAPTITVRSGLIKLVGYGEEELNWMDLAMYRVIVAHACFGGRVEQQFLGDLGGLPGWVLGLGCRLFCAPVAEVPPSVVNVLHRHLAGSGSATFGQRYMAAVRENHAVALYNLYGFADEPVKP